MLYNGMDVSQWQGAIDFSYVQKTDITVVYIKCSEGDNFTDPFWEENYRHATACGFFVGFLHTLTARSPEQARAQACFFLDTIKGKTTKLRFAVDLQDLHDLPDLDIFQVSQAFLECVSQYCPIGCVIYSHLYQARRLKPPLSSHPLWLAQYDVGEPDRAGAFPRWDGWQYTNTGRVYGVPTNVGRNYFSDALFLEQPVTVQGVLPSILSPPGEKSSCNYHTYQIQEGDTLKAIARQYGKKIYQLVSYNHITTPHRIYPGQLLKIPI